MNIKNILELSFINFKTNKFRNVIFILVLSLFITIIICIFSGRSSFLKFIDNNLNGDFEFRLIGVLTNDYNNKELKEILEKKNIKNVTNIFEDSNSFYQIVNFEEEGIVDLYGNYKGINYTIDSGRDIENDNEIVCSSKFYPGNWTLVYNDNDFIDMKKYLNNEFKISFEKYYILNDNDRELIASYNYRLKLVGTFDVNKDLTGYDVCYVSTNFFERISKENTSIYKDETVINELENKVFLLVDEYKNVDLVIKKLSNMGYQTELYAELDLDFFSSVEVVISITTIILSVISIICVYFFIKSTLQENYKNVALYKLLGYEDKIVSLIYLIQYITYTNIALIIGIVLSNIIKIIISSILTFNPNFSVLNIYIFYGPGMIYYLFIIIVIFISLFILFKIKYKKYSPIMLMEDRI